jgi:hypothetical protein
MQLTNMIRLEAELQRERLGSKTMGAKDTTEPTQGRDNLHHVRLAIRATEGL